MKTGLFATDRWHWQCLSLGVRLVVPTEKKQAIAVAGGFRFDYRIVARRTPFDEGEETKIARILALENMHVGRLP